MLWNWWDPFDWITWFWHRNTPWEFTEDHVLYLKHKCTKTFNMLRVPELINGKIICQYCHTEVPEEIITQAKLLEANIWDNSDTADWFHTIP